MVTSLRGNVSKYYAFQILNSLQFFGPVIVIFYLSNGLHMTQVLLLQSLYAITAVLTEVPTGIFADVYGKKASIATGAFLLTLATFLYAFKKTFWWFAICEIIAGSGLAFISGADRAFIHETLRFLKREDEYKTVEGTVRGLSKFSTALGNIIGGFIGAVSLGSVFLFTSVACFISCIVSLLFTSPKPLGFHKRESYLTIATESWLILKAKRDLLWITIFFATYNGLLWSIEFFLQPYLQILHIRIVYFGLIFALFSTIAAIGSGLTKQFEQVTRGNGFVVMSLTAAVSLLLLGFFPSFIILILWSCFDMFSTMNFTLVSERVLGEVPSNTSATILSFQNLARRLCYGVTGPIIGMLGDMYGILFLLKLVSLFLFGFTILLFVIPLKTKRY